MNGFLNNNHIDAAYRVAFFGGCLLVTALLSGCSRTQDAVYSSSESVENLPPLHQTQIRDTLTKHFGTPTNPRLRLISEEADDEGNPLLVDHIDVDRLARGAAVYQRRCAGCHGVTGDGMGEAAAYLNPKPRDYRRGIFKFTSTPYGSKPRRQDIIRTIRHGAKGTSMPSFRWLSSEDMLAVVDFVILLSYRGELEYRLAYEAEEYGEDEEMEPELIWELVQMVHNSWEQAQAQLVQPTTAPPLPSDETVLLGRQAFLKHECYKCHGTDGRGQTEWLSPQFIASQESLPEASRVKINRDAWGNVAPAANLTAGMLHGGRRPIDVYRRIYSGINGTPMPGFAQQFAEQPETIWHLVHFVLSLVEGREFSEPAAVPDETAD